MSNLSGEVGELNFTVQIKRKETGKVEEFKLTGFLDKTKLEEMQNGSDTQHSSQERSD
jgi:hypothetical protein